MIRHDHFLMRNRAKARLLQVLRNANFNLLQQINRNDLTGSARSCDGPAQSPCVKLLDPVNTSDGRKLSCFSIIGLKRQTFQATFFRILLVLRLNKGATFFLIL